MAPFKRLLPEGDARSQEDISSAGLSKTRGSHILEKWRGRFSQIVTSGVGTALGLDGKPAQASTDCFTNPISIPRLAGHDSESTGEFYSDGTVIYNAKVSGDWSLFMTHIDANGVRSDEQELPQLKTPGWYQTDCSDLGDGRVVILESNYSGNHRLHVKDLATGADGEIIEGNLLTVGHLNDSRYKVIDLNDGFVSTEVDNWIGSLDVLNIEKPSGHVDDMHEMSDGRAFISVEPDGSSRGYELYTVKKTVTGATPADSKWEDYTPYPYNSSGRDAGPVCAVTADGEICLYDKSSSATSAIYTMQMTKVDRDCDGMADGEDPCPTDPSPTCGTVIDDDGDGFSPPDDCNDADRDVHPGAAEVCDGKDNDCDRSTDEGVTTTYYRDADGDGYGNPSQTTQSCTQPVGYVSNNYDCEDGDSSIPGPSEITCDGKDNDCKGSTSDNPDQDGDGVKLCSGDCNDADPGRYPGNPEVCGDGIDQDCSGSDQVCPDTPTPTPTEEPTPTTVPTPSASPTPTPQGDLDGDGIPDDIDGSIDSGQVSVEGIDESDVTIDGQGNIIVTDDILEGTQEGVITQLDGDFIYPGGILSGVEGMVMQQNGDIMLFSSASGMRVVVEWNSLTRKNIITNEGTEMVTYRQNDDCEAIFIQPGQQMDLQGIFAVTNPDDCVDQPDPTSTPSPSPTGQPTDSPTPSPTPGVTPTPTDGGTATPSPSPSPSPSQHPTDTPDPSQITPDPSDPSASPSADPTTSPTPPDTQEPTTIPGPTSEPHPSPDPKDTQSESGGGAGCGCSTVVSVPSDKASFEGMYKPDIQGQVSAGVMLGAALFIAPLIIRARSQIAKYLKQG